MLTFNSTLVKTPQGFDVTLKTIYKQNNRNNQGDAMRDFVAVKRVLKIEWPFLTQTELSALLTILNENYFNVTYPDPELGSTTKEFFTADKSVTKSLIYRSETMWEALSVTLEER